MKLIFTARPSEKPWAKLLRRAIRATLLSTFAYYVVLFPFPREIPIPFASLVFQFVDFPISILNAILPTPLQSGCAFQFLDSSVNCFPRTATYERFRYLAVGIPAWTAALYLPDALRAMWPKVFQRLRHGV